MHAFGVLQDTILLFFNELNMQILFFTPPLNTANLSFIKITNVDITCNNHTVNN